MPARKTLVLFGACALVAGVACSSTTSGTGASSSSSSSGSSGSSSQTSSSGGSSSGATSSSGSSGAPGVTSVTGTLGGRAFAAVSGIARVGIGGQLAILLTDEPALCQSLQSQTFAPGATLVQLYGLTGTAPGAFAPVDDNPKYATISSSCPSGSSVNDYVDAAGRDTSAASTITVDTLTSTRAAGELHLRFDDGSTLDGTFDLATCSTEEAENAICE